MAGLGRRTHYRKHVTDSVLYDLHEPEENESIAMVVATRGSNQFDVRFPNTNDSQLAILPTKFRKLVWLKRNDFVIVQTSLDNKPPDDDEHNEVTSPADESGSSSSPSTETADQPNSKEASTGDGEGGTVAETGTIRCMVTHILYNDQIKHLRSKGLWPSDDPDFADAVGGQRETDTAHNEDDTNNDGIVYDTGYGDSESVDDDLFVNTNRISRIAIADSSSDEDSDW